MLTAKAARMAPKRFGEYRYCFTRATISNKLSTA